MQSLIFNDSLKVNIDGHTDPQLHNILVSDLVDGGLKEARYAENIIIISYYTLRSLLLPQLKEIHQDTRLCMVVNVVYIPKLYIPHYYHGVIGI